MLIFFYEFFYEVKINKIVVCHCKVKLTLKKMLIY